MCGIAGFYNYNADQFKISAVIGSLKHRGPDEQNFYQRNDVGLLHTRLAVIELSELGAQPYKFENLILVFNGELYNYKEVKKELIQSGYTFKSNSDTEVLIKAFHCWGAESIHKFIGMFAFCIYDETADELYLFRDRVGVKPLYYSFKNGKFCFASELQALTILEVDRAIDMDSVWHYFRFGFVPAPLSIYSSFKKINPGHYIKVTRNDIIVKKYWEVGYLPIHKTEQNSLDELELLLISAFKYRMVSDVPVGVFLSGGIDSSLLTAVLQKHTNGVDTFTIGFEDPKFDESVFARKVANQLQTNHTERILTRSDARKLLMAYYDIYDEPFADTSGIPTTFVTQIAKEAGMKVVLSADGGDELFGGYTHYQKAFNLYAKFSAQPRSVRGFLSKTSRLLWPPYVRRKISYKNLEHKLFALEELLCTENPVSFFESYVANQANDELKFLLPTKKGMSLGISSNIGEVIQTMMAWDFEHYLPDDLLVKVDRATMYQSVECREPFLDHRIVQFAAHLPVDLKIKDGVSKYLLRSLLNKYLPSEYFQRRKQGFSIPIFNWFKEDLDQMFNNYLSPERLKNVPFINAAEVQRELKKYLIFKRQNKAYNVEKMWRILSFMMWWEKYQKSAA